VDRTDDVGAVDPEGVALGRAQRHVQHGAVLGGVDALTGEHAVTRARDTHALGEGDELFLVFFGGVEETVLNYFFVGCILFSKKY